MNADSSTSNIALLKAYNYVRGRDGTLATSHLLDYIHWMFDINLNENLNFSSSELLFKRGCKYLIEKGVYGYKMSESRIKYDKFNSSRKVKELAVLMKEKL